MKITRKIASFILVALIFACSVVSFAACKNETQEDEHTHTLVKNEAKEATCTENGNVEYWSCSGCDKKYSDSAATNEIDDVTVPAAHTGGTEIRNAVAAGEYEDGYSGDTYCLGCGTVIAVGSVLPHTETSPALIVSSVKKEGNTVSVVISLMNNPGIASLKFDLLYDGVLTMESVEFSSSLGAYATSPEPYINPQSFNWICDDESTVVNGEFVTVTFTVDPELTESMSAEIRIILHENEIFDFEMNKVTLNATGVTVTVNE